MDLQDLQDVYMNNDQVKRYFKNLVPNFQPTAQQQSSSQNSSQSLPQYKQSHYNTNTNTSDTNQVLIDKLNYMINLLEEQQDERTNNVTEEVILYSFLGVFIIFVVDGFARVTRYTR
jgi:regulatory protein YycH of two-component signal transduction system YycFG